MTKGIDVSHWQTLSDWSPEGLEFVIVKASEGTSADPMFYKHVAKARAAGLVVGAYHYNRDDVDIVAQAEFFSGASSEADLHFIDVEGEHQFSDAQARLFMDTFRAKTGRRIGLYHSESGYPECGQDYDWVAHWGVATPTRHWHFHQYRGSPLDLDQYNGTPEELRAFVNGDPMTSLSTYLPGYVSTIDTGSRVRAEPTLNATVLRTTTKQEKWIIVGWAKGEVYNGSTRWLMRWNGKWEYSHEVNVTVAPAEVPPTADDCKTFSDAAEKTGFTAGAASRQPEINALEIEKNELVNEISSLDDKIAKATIALDSDGAVKAREILR